LAEAELLSAKPTDTCSGANPPDCSANARGSLPVVEPRGLSGNRRGSNRGPGEIDLGPSNAANCVVDRVAAPDTPGTSFFAPALAARGMLLSCPGPVGGSYRFQDPGSEDGATAA